MTIEFRPRRSPHSRCATSRVALVALAVIYSWCAVGLDAERAAADDDLNLLLRLLSQDVRLGTTEYARPIDPLWIKDVRGLQSSSHATVAATANAVEESVKMREEALKILDSVQAENEKDADGNSADLGDAINGLLPDGFDIDNAVANRQITPSEAEAYRAQRAAQEGAAFTLAGVMLRRYARSYLADEKVRATRHKAEVLEADAVADHLIPALSARAGPKRDDLPLRIVVGSVADRFLATIISTSDEVLTQLTLLIEIRTPAGRRRAVAFIPKLEPGRGVQVAPIPGDVPADASPDGGPKESTFVVRHSVWCDQFTFAGEKVPLDPSKLARAAYCALVGEQGRGYSFDNLGIRRNPRDRTSYTVEFTDFKPAKETFPVKGKLLFYQTDDREKPSKVTPFNATFRGVEPPRSARSNGRNKAAAAAALTRAPVTTADAQLSIGTGKGKSDIDFFIMESGRVEWMPRSGPLQNRMVRTAEEARQAIDLKAQLDNHNLVLNQARDMASAGQKEQAVAALKDHIAKNPKFRWIAEAERLLKELE